MTTGIRHATLATRMESRMFIILKIKAKSDYHGYDEEGKLIVEPVGSTDFVEKLIKIDRILFKIERLVAEGWKTAEIARC